MRRTEMTALLRHAPSFTFAGRANEGSSAVVTEWDRRSAGVGGLAAAIARDRQEVLEGLYRHGALLFRDTGISDAAGFEAVTRGLVPELVSYIGDDRSQATGR